MEGSIKNPQTNHSPCLIYLLFLPSLAVVIPGLDSELHINSFPLPRSTNPHARGGLKGIQKGTARESCSHLPYSSLGAGQQETDYSNHCDVDISSRQAWQLLFLSLSSFQSHAVMTSVSFPWPVHHGCPRAGVGPWDTEDSLLPQLSVLATNMFSTLLQPGKDKWKRAEAGTSRRWEGK